jgi:photosystem II stability/assembly factor-like uncharacterized protein
MKRRKIAEFAIFCTTLIIPVVCQASDTSHCYLRDAASPTATTAYMLCEQGLVYSTTDGGVSWGARDTGAPLTLHGIAFSDANHGLVAGEAGTLLATEDGAKTWQARTSGTKENLLSISMIGNSAWVSGFDGVLLHSEDGGRTWANQKSGTSMALESVFFLDADHGWAVGWSGTILRTVDGGKNWKEIKSEAAQWSLATVRFFDANSGWAAGFSGQLLHTTDGGLTWKAQRSASQSWLTSLAMDRSKRLWVAADNSLLMSEDGGQTWKSVTTPTGYFVAKLLPVGDSLWAMAELGILKQTGAALEWKRDETFIPAGARIGASVDDSLGAALKGK